jgi:predicted Zn-dependent protease with MMP-like domain
MIRIVERGESGDDDARPEIFPSKSVATLVDCEMFHKRFLRFGATSSPPASVSRFLRARRRGSRKPRAMANSWKRLVKLAGDEVETVIRGLPEDLAAHARQVPVSYESYPSDALVEEGWDPDLLGMYVGDPVGVAEGDSGTTPRQIILYLENLWDYADGEEEIYREEVRVTFIHEFGHYLGLDEDGLEERGLL